MAVRGTFTQELLPEGWFDETLKPEGWFSQDFLEPAAAGGDAALTGTSSLTFSPSGQLVTVAAVSGASTLTFAPTGSLAGTSQITGATTLTFTTSGALNGAALMGGASFPAFTLSGELTTGALLSGAANLNFTPTGTLTGDGGEPPVVVPPLAEINWPGIAVERQRANLVQSLIQQAKERGKDWIEANKPQVRRTIRRTIERELKAQGLLTDAIMGQVAPMVADALESLPLLDFDALQRQLAQFDLIIWQQAERLAEESRLAMMADDEDAMIVLFAAA
jgi:hypothetical protein